MGRKKTPPGGGKKDRTGSRGKSVSKCQKCGSQCCRYITVKIPAPRTLRDFDGLLWQLAHEKVKAFRDARGWQLLVENPCRHLNGRGECAIYANRPITCREHSSEYCEYDGPISETAAGFFDSYEKLDAYCRRRFATWDRRR